MTAIPASTPPPVDSVLFAQSPVSVDQNMEDYMDGFDEVVCSLSPGQKVRDETSDIYDNVDDNEVSMTKVNGEDVRAGNSRPGGLSQPPVTGGQLHAAAELGQGLHGTQRAQPQAPALPTGQHSNRNSLLNRGGRMWRAEWPSFPSQQLGDHIC